VPPLVRASCFKPIEAPLEHKGVFRSSEPAGLSTLMGHCTSCLLSGLLLQLLLAASSTLHVAEPRVGLSVDTAFGLEGLLPTSAYRGFRVRS
jgi:hypothetical protein